MFFNKINTNSGESKKVVQEEAESEESSKSDADEDIDQENC